MNNLLLGYAANFAGFLLQNLEQEDTAKIGNIILFGSVARGTSRPNSDIDIFVDTEDSRLKNKCNMVLDKFFKSDIYRRYWRLLGIKNEIKLITDSMKNWPDMQTSIFANGIVLFGKYKNAPKGKPSVIVWWDAIKNQSKRVLISKTLYGWSVKKKKHAGLLEKLGGRKLGSNAIIIPLENASRIKWLFKSHKVQAREMYLSKIE